MLQLLNHTPFAASLAVFTDKQGIECAFAIVKASFEWKAGATLLAESQAPLVATDVYWGDPVKTSLKAAGEFSLPKPSTDVLLVGQAVAPRTNTRIAQVSLKVGNLAKTLYVFGNRHWQKTTIGWQASEPEIWEQMPLRWELAFGGSTQADNPVGRGLIENNEWEGALLPNLEHPKHLIQHPTDRVPPACFAPIAPAWLPRRAFAGTYNAAWQKTRAPYLPEDFDARFFLTAPADLIADGYLHGGEAVEIQGCALGEPSRFVLPVCHLETIFHFNRQTLNQTPHLETVLFEPNINRMQLLWRAGIQVDKHLLKLREVTVRCREYSHQAIGE